ncbi:MAG TPA: DUF308 domain-containing protein [Actinoplanes sp.]|nr:DUF308 domain-containing protein [Actinoplanes sp.]
MRSSLIWRAVLALIVGIVSISWPDITVGAFVILFAVYCFFAGVMEGTRAFRSEAAGPVVGRLLLAVLDIAAGVVALAWPGITALALVYFVAIWAVVTGITEVGLAFRASDTAGRRALLALTGLVSVALGVALFARPGIGAVSLAQVYGFFSLVTAATLTATAFNLRSVSERAKPVTSW